MSKKNQRRGVSGNPAKRASAARIQMTEEMKGARRFPIVSVEDMPSDFREELAEETDRAIDEMGGLHFAKHTTAASRAILSASYMELKALANDLVSSYGLNFFKEHFVGRTAAMSDDQVSWKFRNINTYELANGGIVVDLSAMPQTRKVLFAWTYPAQAMIQEVVTVLNVFLSVLADNYEEVA